MKSQILHLIAAPPIIFDCKLLLSIIWIYVFEKSCIKSYNSKYLHWCAIEILQQVFRKMFQLFCPPSQMNLETIDTSFESPYIGRLESAKKLAMAPSWGWPRPLYWKSTTFTKTCLEPFMTKILPVSKLFSNKE